VCTGKPMPVSSREGNIPSGGSPDPKAAVVALEGVSANTWACILTLCVQVVPASAE
jgi:hypothetical protein